jgi:hypothetical protein
VDRLVVVRDFDVVGTAILPPEANPVLIVDADTVLSDPRTAQGLEAVTRWNRQFAQCPNPIQLRQLARYDRPQRRRTRATRSPAVDPIEEIFRRRICKMAYHAVYYNGCRSRRQSYDAVLNASLLLLRFKQNCAHSADFEMRWLQEARLEGNTTEDWSQGGAIQ